MGFWTWLTGASDEGMRDRAVHLLVDRANATGNRRMFDTARVVGERSDLRGQDVPRFLRSYARDTGDAELSRAADDIERGR